MSTENNQQAPAEEHIMTEEELGEQRQIRRNKLADLRAMGRDPYVIETYDVTAHSMDIKDNYEAMEDQEVSVAGRIMSKRVMGKAAFFDILDKQGRILLPRYLKEHAKIQKDIVVIGARDYAEIWDRQAYEEYEKTNDFSSIEGKLDDMEF